MSAVRQISGPGSIKLLADLLEHAEEEVTKLRTIMVREWCTCKYGLIDPLNASLHAPSCRYRELVS